MTSDPPRRTGQTAGDESTEIRSEVARRLDLQQIRYAMVWEDHALLDAGLRIEPDDDVIAITSAGNNVLSLLLREPRSITAVDMSPAQTALLELKLAGIRHLARDEFVALLGFTEADRVAIYRRVRDELPPDAAEFWDANTETLEHGIRRCGRLERYFETFAEEHLAELWPAGLVERMFDASTLREQVETFETEAFTPEFQARFCDYFGRESMAARGRDPAQFEYVDRDDVGGYFLERFRLVCTTLPMRGNFYLERFLTGTHRDLEQGPEYLRSTEFARLRSLLDRVIVVTAELEEHLASAPDDTYTKAALSNVFEYMSPVAATMIFEELARAIAPGGRIAHWSLLVRRAPPDALADRLRALTAEADRLWERDRSWFYGAFHLSEVVE